MDWDGLVRNGEAILAASALITALGFLLRKAWRWIRTAAHLIDNTMPRAIRAIDDVVGDDDQPGLRSELATIKHELYPNGGGSLRDAVNRAQQRAEEAADSAAEIAAALGRTHAAGNEQRVQLIEMVDNLALSLAHFARDTRQRERRYVEAARELGLDLTGVTEDLNEDQ